jgi:hypothetical protein
MSFTNPTFQNFSEFSPIKSVLPDAPICPKEYGFIISPSGLGVSEAPKRVCFHYFFSTCPELQLPSFQNVKFARASIGFSPNFDMRFDSGENTRAIPIWSD